MHRKMKPAPTARPVHPGEVLREEFLAPLGLSAAALARRIGVTTHRVSEIAAGRRAVTDDTALRLAQAFGTAAEFWMNLQKGWELETARCEARPTVCSGRDEPSWVRNARQGARARAGREARAVDPEQPFR